MPLFLIIKAAGMASPKQDKGWVRQAIEFFFFFEALVVQHRD